MNRLIVSQRAVTDLERIGDDIAMWSPAAAVRIVARLEEISRLLRDFPHVGTLRDDIEEGMRTFPVGNTLVLFRALEDGAEIVRYVDGRRDPDNLL
ncbi:MAG: type II toxin-antitoxin system RelE/ParE family toxin [Roseiarcus sp.]